MNTLFLATVMGWYFVIVGFYLLLKQDHVKSVFKEVMAKPGLYFFIAIITLILGLLLVTSHNIWVRGWPVVITILCWLVLIGGLMRLFFPDAAMKMSRSFIEHPLGLKLVSLIVIVLGLFLLSQVYFPGVLFR